MTETAELQEYRRQYPLHAHAADYGSGAVRDDEHWFNTFERLLSQCKDPQALDSYGASIWSLLEPSGSAPFNCIGQAVNALIKKGVNPLKVGRRIPLFIETMGSFCTWGAHEAIAFAAIETMASLEDSAPMRSEVGGNVLHTLCAERPETVAEFMEHHDPIPGNGRMCLPQSWFNETDAQGRKPLEILWGDGGAVERLDNCCGHIEAATQLEAVWLATGALVKAGAALDAIDSQGQVIGRRVLAHTSSQAWETVKVQGTKLWADLEAIAMDTHTPAARGPDRSVRL